MSHEVLVVGNGRRYHISHADAEKLVRDRRAFWQKKDHRIKVIKVRRVRPKVHDLSCIVGEHVMFALRGADGTARDVAQTFVNSVLPKRKRGRLDAGIHRV